MSGRMSRSKGRRAQTIAANMLRERDWVVADLSAGVDAEDLLATDPSGVLWAVEVKDCKTMVQAHIKQAKDQALKRKARWMLMQHIYGTSSWIVSRQGEHPVIWRVGENDE